MNPSFAYYIGVFDKSLFIGVTAAFLLKTDAEDFIKTRESDPRYRIIPYLELGNYNLLYKDGELA
jgi:hypothetical protein